MAFLRSGGILNIEGGGGVGGPQFTETLLADDSSLTGTLDFDGVDYHDYELIKCELYNSSSQEITNILTTPQILDDLFQYLSRGVLFNELYNYQYCYY